MNSKSPGQNTVEELLKALESDEIPDESPLDDEVDDVFRFITTYNIRPGESWVSGRLLFKLFCLTRTNPLSWNEWRHRMGIYFPYNRCKFRLDVSQLAISEAYHKALRAPSKKPGHQHKWRNALKKFYADVGIKEGKFFVPTYALVYWYDEWFYQTKRKNRRINYKSASALIRTTFPNKHIRNRVAFVGINKECKTFLTPEKLQRYEEMHQKEKRKPKARNAPLPREISRFKTSVKFKK